MNTMIDNIIRTDGYITLNSLIGAGIGVGLAKITPNGNAAIGVLVGSVTGAIIGTSAIVFNNFVSINLYTISKNVHAHTSI